MSKRFFRPRPLGKLLKDDKERLRANAPFGDKIGRREWSEYDEKRDSEKFRQSLKDKSPRGRSDMISNSRLDKTLSTMASSPKSGSATTKSLIFPGESVAESVSKSIDAAERSFLGTDNKNLNNQAYTISNRSKEAEYEECRYKREIIDLLKSEKFKKA